ncbi:Hypothetical predicted protein [Marmota monax]|uniref:Uncharacterized protein n=1 Tax=Marmota monax TaxID=9995 RepID=A0A5E4BFH2_MARMO|nr:hypothetical protein GHT09_020325 [Marmota monax]VTJ67332.1 Hypothetical predicted protein [Marmota monax]
MARKYFTVYYTSPPPGRELWSCLALPGRANGVTRSLKARIAGVVAQLFPSDIHQILRRKKIRS